MSSKKVEDPVIKKVFKKFASLKMIIYSMTLLNSLKRTLNYFNEMSLVEMIIPKCSKIRIYTNRILL